MGAATERRVFVLGHRGMLGHVVARYAADAGWEVITSPARYGAGTRDPLIEQVRESGASVVINCLGLTKQRSDDRAALYVTNAVFPVQLAMRMSPSQYLVHASTDCVFAGTRGGYRLDDECDATDAYGFSKLLGEGVSRLANVTVLRVSVVGPDRGDGRGLLAWFLRQPAGQSIPGYVNHRWNGITTLEWATIALAHAEEHVRGGIPPKLSQPGTEGVTKYELLCAFRDAFAANRCVVPVEAPTAVDRTLVPTDERPPFAQQLRSLAAWYPLTGSAK
jgi:dTDP-4-dehydrorhamnose reductase